MKIYLVGSLKDPDFSSIATWLRAEGFEVFDDWRSAGAEADTRWREYETRERRRGYADALFEPFATTAREFDCRHIDNSDLVVAVCPLEKLPGRSAIAELGYASRRGLPTAILLRGDPDEWDLMLPLVAEIFDAADDLLAWLRSQADSKMPSEEE